VLIGNRNHPCSHQSLVDQIAADACMVGPGQQVKVHAIRRLVDRNFDAPST
jgi:hypothetical protein